MARAIGITLACWLGVMGPVAVASAEAPSEAVIRDVEAAFRGAMEMWAYREFWHLWEVSTRESRFAITQNEFAAQMDRGTARAAAGRRVEDLRISVTSPLTAMVLARIGLEDPRTNTTQSIVRSFLFHHQEGRWRPQLSDFLGLSTYVPPMRPIAGPVILLAPCCPVRVTGPRSHGPMTRP